jgi:hypothetical protein
MREHSLGPYPLDPNLIAQGVPPDDRIDFNDRIHAPTEGTPLPPGAVPAQAPPPIAPPGNSVNGVPVPPVEPAPVEPAPASDGAVPAAPSAFSGNGSGGPSVAFTHYDPADGRYLTPDGQLQQLTNVSGAEPKSWKDLLPT